MSADNWTDCPNCADRHKKLKDLYGKIPFEEYSKQLEVIDNQSETMREDYEIGISNGKFHVGYYATCTHCQFHFEYKYTKDLDLDEST